MAFEFDTLFEKNISCSSCEASCCRLKVMIISETGVPDHLIDFDQRGGGSMLRLDDGWCVALDRNTMKCTIYEKRPAICRDFEMGGEECIVERIITS